MVVSIETRRPAWHHDAMAGSRRTTGYALAASCHPVPTAAVTVLATVLVASAGNRLETCAVAAAAILTGQLAIGWSNDALDAARDSEVGRTDKPVAQGLLSRHAVWTAAASAALATVPLSLALGWRSGLVQLSVVAWGGLYNWCLKSTVLSPLPFLFAFGGLPALATLARPAHALPPIWTLVAAGLIGVSAHFGNVLPDLEDDRRTGVSGIPQRLGRSGSSLAAVSAAFSATVLTVVMEAAGSTPILWVLAVTAAGLGGIGVLVARQDPRSEAVFFAAMGVAATGVAMIVSSHALR